MATLSSPGVAVTVIDESFYTPAAAGTVPLFIVASASNKQNGAGTGTAPGTLPSNAGTVYLLTSQKDLSDTFGIPKFYTDAENNPIHAGEQNEYGLEAAYSFLGVSNRAYVVRADLDLDGLSGTATTPHGSPADGTYWLDTADTLYGVFQWNQNPATSAGGQTFTEQQSANNLMVITDTTKCSSDGNGGYIPLASVGAIGDYAVVAITTLQKLFLKKYLTDTAAGTWVEVGTAAWAKSWPTATGTVSNSSNPNLTGLTMTINGTSVNAGFTTLTGLITNINATSLITAQGITAANVNGFLNLYSNGTATVYGGAPVGSITLAGTAVVAVGLQSTQYLCPALTLAPHTQIPLYKISDNTSTANGRPTGSLWVKTTSPNLGADWIIKQYNSATGAWVSLTTGLYATNAAALAGLDPVGGGINLAAGVVYVKYNDDEASPALSHFKLYKRIGVGATTIRSIPIATSTFTAGTNTVTFSESIPGGGYTTAVSVSFTATGASTDANLFLTAFTAALPNSNLSASLNSDNSITIAHVTGGEIVIVDSTNYPMSKIFTPGTTANYYVAATGTAHNFVASLWSPTVNGTGFATISQTAPTTVPADGTLWYDTNIASSVDIMINNGTYWKGYLNYTQNQVGGTTTDPNGPILSATKPTVQSDATPLSNGDLWIDTSDTENFPVMYKYNYLKQSWTLIDNADQTSENGIVFGDARWNTDGGAVLGDSMSSIPDLLSSDYVDFDCPDPLLYPRGTLLFNTRRSGFNVKNYHVGYVDTTARNTRYNGAGGVAGVIGSGQAMTNYYANRWVSLAPNAADGSGQFGRKAQRAVVVAALNAEVNANQDLRDEESRVFNLIACPGYTELITAMVSLNYDRGLTAFVVADTPARLTPDATTLNNWGNNVDNAVDNGEMGLINTDPYVGIYYPWGYSTDLVGNNIVVPPSHMMMRTIALSDNVSYPWFAPAGTRRGGITNASSTGYVTSQGEFVATALNTGQRDTLAGVHVNPITYITGTGLVAYGQYTRQLTASSLDRVNVARLVVFLRRQLSRLAKPYVFEPNDTITRNEIKQAAESLLLELVGQRAIYDYVVVCDTSNNTPSRIDRSELYLDIAIEPVKAVEFIYIPLRLENTGAIKGLGGN